MEDAPDDHPAYNCELDAWELYHKDQEQTSLSSSSTSALPALAHGLAGSIGAALSNVCIYPLALIIARKQTQRHKARKPSPSSTTSPSNAPKKLKRESSFVPDQRSRPGSTVYPTHNRGNNGDDDEHEPSSSLLSLPHALHKIYTDEGGFTALYRGCTLDTAKTIADSFLFFLAYHYLRDRRLASRQGRKHLSAIDELGVGFVAGSLARFCTTPLGNVVARVQTQARNTMQEQDSDSDGPDSSGKIDVRRIVAQIMRDKGGWQGLWSGYSASLVLTLNPTLTFFFHEMLKRMFVARVSGAEKGKQEISGRAVFLLAALSKAMASSITYPFSLAKTRAQVSSKASAEPGVGNGNETKDVEQEGEHKVDEAVAEGLATASGKESTANTRPAQAAKKAARVPGTAFAMIAHIVRTEGVGSLYEGLELEVLKGFLNHGLTMVSKETVHKFILQLWYWVLGTMGRK